MTAQHAQFDYDVIIIGAGIVGCAIARELSRYQTRVLLLEKNIEVGFGTSKANSGIVHGGHRASLGTRKGGVEWKGNQAWDQLHRELGFGFRRCGELTVAFSDDDFLILKRLLEQGTEKGIPGLELWDQATLRQAEPNLNSDIVAALFAPTTGVINPYEACYALAESAVVNGVTLRTQATVIGLKPTDEGWCVQTAEQSYRGRFVINAAGLYADEIAGLAGVHAENSISQYTIRPRKGEEYLLDKRLDGIVSRVIFPCPNPKTKGILVIPTFDGTIMVGPTAELMTDKTDLGTTEAGAQTVFAAAQRLVPSISITDSIAGFAGLRAVLDTEDFYIHAQPEHRFIHVAGIQSPGLTAAPAIACDVVERLGECGFVPIKKDDFQPSLPPPVIFAALDPEAQARLVEADNRFGQIVCRCEMITEGEIAQALVRGARTLDGLKFRTRAGMGRCQGGFCTWRCMEMLARFTGQPVDQITKRGEGTWLVCQ